MSWRRTHRSHKTPAAPAACCWSALVRQLRLAVTCYAFRPPLFDGGGLEGLNHVQDQVLDRRLWRGKARLPPCLGHAGHLGNGGAPYWILRCMSHYDPEAVGVTEHLLVQLRAARLGMLSGGGVDSGGGRVRAGAGGGLTRGREVGSSRRRLSSAGVEVRTEDSGGDRYTSGGRDSGKGPKNHGGGDPRGGGRRRGEEGGGGGREGVPGGRGRRRTGGEVRRERIAPRAAGLSEARATGVRRMSKEACSRMKSPSGDTKATWWRPASVRAPPKQRRTPGSGGQGGWRGG